MALRPSSRPSRCWILDSCCRSARRSRLSARRPPDRACSNAEARLARGRSRAAVALAAAGLGGATLCAEVALLPVGARLFGRVSFAGLVLNFAAVPLMSLIQVAGLAAVAVHPVSRRRRQVCGWLAHVGTIALLGSARLVDIWPWLVIDVPAPPMWVIGLWYASAGVLVAWWRRPRIRAVALAAIAAAGALIVAGPPQLRPGGRSATGRGLEPAGVHRCRPGRRDRADAVGWSFACWWTRAAHPGHRSISAAA